MGAWCRETGDFISEKWDTKVHRRARVASRSDRMSIPFLESYSLLASVLTLTPGGHRVIVYTDCSPAAHICNTRWSKTSKALNSFIAHFDYECTNRDIFVQAELIPRGQNYGAHHLSQGQILKAQARVRLGRRRRAEQLRMLF